ncbi:MAG: QueT transporter family protein [Bulleidia sp.]|nr:QueT transporter family protein [Bulleidia sp.]
MNLKHFTRIAMTAAIYTAVSFVPGLNTLAFGPIQVRIAEALTILPIIYDDAVWGVTLGCLITNMLGVATGLTGPIDIFVGTLATLLAALCTRKLKDKTVKGVPVWSILMPVIFNFFFVGTELAWMLNRDQMFTMMWIYGAEVAVGEAIAVVLGYFLTKALAKTNIFEQQ